MLKTCLFDLGNVLLKFSHEKMCRQMACLANRTEADTRREFLESGRQIGFELGESSDETFHAWFEEFAGSPVGWDDLKTAVADIFEPIPEMPAILDRLKSQGLRLVLLSNTNSAHIDFVERNFDLLPRFDHLVLSHRVGALKPEEAIYREALARIDCAPSECFYTDDIAAYVDAGRKHGLQAEVFTSAESLREHLSVRGVSV